MTAFKLRGQDKRLTVHLVERVDELRFAVGRVDIDKDQTCLGRGELCNNPFDVIGRPDSDPVTSLQIQCQQTGGKCINGRTQLPVCPADILMPDNDGLFFTPLLNRLVKCTANRLVNEWLITGTGYEAA